MTPERQRIVIAEVCPFIIRYGKGEILWRVSGRMVYFDPLNDLNAIHSAVMENLHLLGGGYTMELRKIVVRDATDEMAHDGKMIMDVYFYQATAAQRAEAFLRTLNKWEES